MSVLLSFEKCLSYQAYSLLSLVQKLFELKEIIVVNPKIMIE